MTESADRSQRPPPSARGVGRDSGFSGTVRDELAKLRGKSVGACAGCGLPVFLQQSFTRVQGQIVHVRCAVGARPAVPTAGSGRLARQRQLTSRDG